MCGLISVSILHVGRLRYWWPSAVQRAAMFKLREDGGDLRLYFRRVDEVDYGRALR